LIFSSDSVTVGEGSNTTFTVRLRVLPSDPVTVTLSQPDDKPNTDVTFDTDSDTNGNQNTLEFTTSNWETAQTVTVSAKEDDDGIQDKATITMSASGGDYSSVSGSIEVTVTENDTPGILVSKNSLTITEGSSDTFMVKLATQPSEDVTVSIAQTGTNNSNVTATPASLTFTASNWKTDQTVTVNAAEDNEDEVDETATLRVSASGGDYGSVAHKDVSVRVDDNDKPGITLSSDSVTLTEGSNTTFTVVLDAEPSANVTVSITQPDDPNADVTVDTDTETVGNQTELTFTTLNWQTAQTVTVNAAEDIDLTDDTATLRVGATGGGYGSVTGSVGVTVEDNDLLGLEVSKASLTIREGASGSFTVKPEIRTSGNVTVTLVQPSNTDVTVTPASLIFTTENWETAQEVTVNTKDDDDGIKDTATIIVSASAGGYGTVTGSIGVTVNDSDTPGLTFDPTSVTLTEGSNTTFTVKLATKPSTSVTVRLVQPADNTDVTVDTDTETVGNQTELTFTTSNWQTAQTVTVSAADDEDRNNDSATITMSASGGDYNAVPGSIEVTVNDNDVPGLTVSATSLTIREGTSGSFTVKLQTQPSGDVTVTITQPTNPNSDVTVDTKTDKD
ncbi:MAG: hypothetical protein ISN29_08535, partial [Gammaproteobacteria bacterium AqS3]|nr:hypothetical protein [Gammaproteobacteria bacterium AqS3]